MVETRIKGDDILCVQAILQSLENLVQIHEELLETSKQKTEIVKKGSADKLQKVVITEYKQIQKLERAEAKREKVVEEWAIRHQVEEEDATISYLLEYVADAEEKKSLAKLAIKLTEVITDLKQQEQLNQQLLNQSMQFVQLSLHAIDPTSQHVNYGKEQTHHKEQRSVFDSKA